MNLNNASRRTLQKVRRDSRLVGTVEASIWRPTNKREMRAGLEAAERYEIAHKPKGKRNGPLGYVALRIYRELWRRVRFTDGCLCPSYEYLMRKCRLSKAAVAAGLRRLKAHGFLDWVRRLEYTGGPPPGVRGPQVRQVSNAYALSVPAAALELLGRLIMPADEITRVNERAAFVSECEAADFGESRLGRAVDALGRAIEARAQRFNNASLLSARNPAMRSI